MMPDSMCRLAVQHGPDTVELALPTDAPVGVLLPSVVDLVEPGGRAADEGLRWHLSRVGHGPLDEAITLHDNGVHDGELLVLATAPPPTPVRVPDDPWQVLVETHDRRCTPPWTAAAACLGVSMLGATVLVWAGIVAQSTGNVVTAGAITATAAAAAVAARRRSPDPIVVVTLSVIAVMFGAITGFLAVPARPSTANALLAAATGFAISLLLLRVTRCGATCLTALATATALTTAATACGVAWALPITTTAALLAALALATLGAAARLSIAAAGLAHADDDSAELTPHAIAAHHSLTGLVTGSAAAAAFGAALVEAGTPARPNALVFSAVVGLVLMLRARTHVDTHRSIALATAGMAAMAADCLAFAISAPAHAHWAGLAALATGVVILGRGFGMTGNVLAHRAVDVLEYAALAAVLPLACWVGDLYVLVLS
jgi:type VII secretion integral membrane protein EccD